MTNESLEEINSFLEENQYDKACEACRVLCDVSPENEDVVFLLGSIQILQKDYKQAIDAFESLKKLNADYANLKFNLGLAYLECGDHLVAETHFLSELVDSSCQHVMAAEVLFDMYTTILNKFSPTCMQAFEPLLIQVCKNNEGNNVLMAKLLTIQVINQQFSEDNPYNIVNSRVELLDLLPKNGIVSEIGVRYGDYAEKILEINIPKKLHLIDCWEVQEQGVDPDTSQNSKEKFDEMYTGVVNRFEEKISKKQVILHRGYSSDMLKKFDDDTFDWVYIDANHSYKYAKEDLELSLEKVKKGGYICGHDYVSAKLVSDFGVKRAVDELVKSGKVEFVTLTHEYFASYMLKKL